MTHISLDTAFEGLRTIVAREPHRKGTIEENQSGCAYAVVSDGVLKPSCIVGQFFANIGLLGLLVTDPLGALANAIDTPAQMGACSVDVWHSLEYKGVTVDHDAQLLFAAVQREQDGGSEWSLAFKNGVQTYHDEVIAELPSVQMVAIAASEHMLAQEPSPLPEWEQELLGGNPWDN